MFAQRVEGLTFGSPLLPTAHAKMLNGLVPKLYVLGYVKWKGA